MLTLEEIKERMSDRNIAEVARRIGVTRVWLSYVLNDRRPISDGLRAKLTEYLEARP